MGPNARDEGYCSLSLLSLFILNLIPIILCHFQEKLLEYKNLSNLLSYILHIQMFFFFTKFPFLLCLVFLSKYFLLLGDCKQMLFAILILFFLHHIYNLERCGISNYSLKRIYKNFPPSSNLLF